MNRFHTFIGHCIYCGSKEPPLSREHVMPRGLGGGIAPTDQSDALVLSDASCEDCRKKTQKIEEACLTEMFRFVRTRLGLRRKDRMPEQELAPVRLRDGTEEKRLVNTVDLPGFFAIPVYRPAMILTGQPSESPDIKFFFNYNVRPNAVSDLQGIGVGFKVNEPRFAQMLAKIAHGIAVAHLGPQGFHPFVRDLIRFLPNDYKNWVGGKSAGIEEPKGEKMHEISMRREFHPRCGEVWVVYIQLFADCGGPINYVVVGKPLDARDMPE